MIAIKSFIELVIYLAIVAIIIELILPKGNTKKYVYVILSLFMLLNIVSPIISVIKDANMQDILGGVLETISTNTQTVNNNEIQEFSEYKNVKVTESLKEGLSKEIKSTLLDMGIEFKGLNLSLNDDYEFEELKISIGNLDHIKDKKIEKISDIITKVSEKYNLEDNTVRIIEEGK